MSNSTITADALSAIAGAILSLVFRYMPGLNDKYQTLGHGKKVVVMVGCLAAAAVGTAMWGCLDRTDQSFGACFAAVEWAPYVRAFVFAFVTNQSVFGATKKKDPEPEPVKP